MKTIKRVGVLGSGEVGKTLAKGLKAHGYEVHIGSRSPAKLAAFSNETKIPSGTFSDVAAWGEAVVLSVVGRAAKDALSEAQPQNLAGKPILDTTNPISDEPPEDGVIRCFTGPNRSLMEELQGTFPQAHFVKAFNSVGSDLMVNPKFSGGKPTMFYCGNNADAKAFVAKIIDQFGWEGADMGTAVAARAIEPLAVLWCIPGFRQNQWNDHAFHLMRL